MSLDIMRSYRNVAGMSARKSSSLATGMDHLNSLKKQIPGTAFFVGTVSYGQTYGNSRDNNFVIHPKYLEKLSSDPDLKNDFEQSVMALNAHSDRFRAAKAAEGREVVSEGWFCDENGNWGGWSVTRPTNTKSHLQKMREQADEIYERKAKAKIKAQKLEKIKENHIVFEKHTARNSKDTIDFSDKAKQAMAQIADSKNEQPDEISEIAEPTEADIIPEISDISDVSETADTKAKNAEEVSETEEEEKAEKEEDEAKTPDSENGGSVAVNVGKRMRMIAAAKTADNVRVVLQLLEGDLKECKDGLEKGWCDENEIAKVEALIELANKRMSEVAGNDTEDPAEQSAFELSMLF